MKIENWKDAQKAQRKLATMRDRLATSLGSQKVLRQQIRTMEKQVDKAILYLDGDRTEN